MSKSRYLYDLETECRNSAAKLLRKKKFSKDDMDTAQRYLKLADIYRDMAIWEDKQNAMATNS